MIRVRYGPPADSFVVSFNYDPEYVARIRSIPGARYNPELKCWYIGVGAFRLFEEAFRGEIVYETPRHLLAGEDETRHYHDDIAPVDNVPTTLPLYGFQKFGATFLARRAVQHGFAFLCDSTGIGKTCQALGARLLLLRELGLDRLPTLVVAPAAVRHQWVADAVPKFLGGDVSVAEVEGEQAERLTLYSSAEIAVTNYEALLRDADLLPRRLKFGLVILDECQRVKNRTGKTHRALRRLFKRMPHAYRFFLTATPVMNDLDELYALFELASPGFFGKYSEFRECYMRVDHSHGWPKLVGYRNLDELADRVGPYILRRTEEHPEVAASLPELVVQNLYVDPDGVQRNLHSLLYREWVELMRERSAARDAAALRELNARCRGHIVLMQGAADDPRLFLMSTSGMVRRYLSLAERARGPSPKLAVLIELVQDLTPQGKVLIFTCFERMAQLIVRALEYQRCALFTGQNKEDREAELARFRNDPDCRVLVATDAGGVGLNLQAARYVVNFDLPWSPGQLEQRYGRIKRFGSSHRSVLAINLLTRGTIDERILAALERKEDVFQAVITPTV